MTDMIFLKLREGQVPPTWNEVSEMYQCGKASAPTEADLDAFLAQCEAPETGIFYEHAIARKRRQLCEFFDFLMDGSFTQRPAFLEELEDLEGDGA